MPISVSERLKRIHAARDLNAVVAVCADVSDSGRPGPLAGCHAAVKVNIAVQGMPLTAASRVLEGYRAPDHARGNATCVTRLEEGGATVVALTNMDEFGMGSSTERGLYGPTRNPWDQARTAGGSSGGSAAAVAAGLCDLALGTDTGGSVRQPAAFCGVVGIKPTYGRVSRRGVVAYASSLDQVGVLARDVDVAAAGLATICRRGPDDDDMTVVANPLPSLAAPLRAGLRVGVLRQRMAGVDAAVERGVYDAAARLRDAGAVVSDVDVPHLEHAVAAYYVIATAEASSNLSRYDGVRFGPRQGSGGGAPRGLIDLYEGTRALFGEEVRRRVLLGTFVLSHGFYEAYLVQAQRARALIAQAMAAALVDIDVLLLPVAPTQPFTLGERLSDPLAMYLGDLFTLPASLAGLPAAAVPVGTDGGLPVSVQLIARAYDEGTLLSAARAVCTPLTPPWSPPLQ